MRVFVTGATGFIGSRVVGQLLGHGHQVIGLARSETGVRRLEEAGAAVHRATLEEPAALASGAEQADAVIHTAFDHTFENFVTNCEKDARVIEALGRVLKESDRPLLITSGTGIGSRHDGDLAMEDVFDRDNANPRRLSEITGEAVAATGVSVAAMRLPQVHDTEKQGLITPLIAIARAKGVSAYVGDGANRWPAAHVDDVARLYRLALEGHRPGVRWHAVDEEGVPVRAIAQAIGDGLGIPVRAIDADEAPAHFGWMGPFMAMDMPASSAWTRATLEWRPHGPKLLDDLHAMDWNGAAEAG